jgi:hypothetical protein
VNTRLDIAPLIVLLDVSGSMAEQEKFEVAKYVCASVAAFLRVSSADGLVDGVRIFASAGEEFSEVFLHDDTLRRLKPTGRFGIRFACERVAEVLESQHAQVLLLTDQRVGTFLFDHELASFLGELHLILLGIEHGDFEPELREDVSHYSADDAMFALQRMLSRNSAVRRIRGAVSL